MRLDGRKGTGYASSVRKIGAAFVANFRPKPTRRTCQPLFSKSVSMRGPENAPMIALDAMKTPTVWHELCRTAPIHDDTADEDVGSATEAVSDVGVHGIALKGNAGRSSALLVVWWRPRMDVPIIEPRLWAALRRRLVPSLGLLTRSKKEEKGLVSRAPSESGGTPCRARTYLVLPVFEGLDAVHHAPIIAVRRRGDEGNQEEEVDSPDACQG